MVGLEIYVLEHRLKSNGCFLLLSIIIYVVNIILLLGKDFQAIAETLGTKSEAHVRTFFISYRRRYNLDAVLREHEAERGMYDMLLVYMTSLKAETHNKHTYIKIVDWFNTYRFIIKSTFIVYNRNKF